MSDMNGRPALPVVVIGAGPVGLAAAARLVAERVPFVLVEAGDTPGAAVLQWEHVRLFTPWRYLIDDAARALLEPMGWRAPDPDGFPTGRDLFEHYLQPLGSVPAIGENMRLSTRVIGVSRRGLDKGKSAFRAEAPFDVRTVDSGGRISGLSGRAVIDASGTYGSPRLLGSNGLPAHGESAASRHIFYGIPDVRGRHRARYAGKHVAVVGSGHSAFNTLLDLETLVTEDGTSATWFVRSADLSRHWGGGGADQLSQRGQLGQRMRALAESGAISVVSGFAIDSVWHDSRRVVLTSVDGRRSDPIDEVIAVTGFQPDLSLTRELRLGLDAVVEAPVALAPLIDPNLHSCGTVPPHGYRELAHPEADFYTVGMKSYGRAPTFLLMTGYEQVRSVVKALVGDLEAAGRVELCLPETGVCVTDYALAGAAVAAPGVSARAGCCS